MNGCILAFRSPPFVTDRFGSKSKHSRGDRRYPAKAGRLAGELGSQKRSFRDAELPRVAKPEGIRDHAYK